MCRVLYFFVEGPFPSARTEESARFGVYMLFGVGEGFSEQGCVRFVISCPETQKKNMKS